MNRVALQIQVPEQARGFTLTELVVLVAMGAFLSLLLIPAVAKTRPNGKATQCSNNLRQFTAAWTMYSADNAERVPDNYGLADTVATIQSAKLATWANNVMSWTAGTSLSDRSNTNVDWVSKGVLGMYLGDPLRVYKCPADKFLSTVQVANGYPARVRSISMSAVFGRYSPGNDATAGGINPFLPQYLQYLKRISVPKPAKTWLVLDEHPDSINDGYFINNPSANSWGDIPAAYHNGACGFAFVDGHSELKRWQSRSSIYPVTFSYFSNPFDLAGRQDFAWYLEHTGFVNAATGQPAFNY